MTPEPPPPSSSDPAERIRMIEQSLSAYIHGWFGLLPVIGIPSCIYSAIMVMRVRRLERRHWNPAAGYRITAIWLDVIGGAIGGGIIFMVLLRIVLD